MAESPPREVLALVRAARAAARDRRAAACLPGRSLADVRRVVVVQSASRSGSSLLYALLRRLPGVVSLTGEAAPFYKLALGCDDPAALESDRVPAERLERDADLAGLGRDFLTDLYRAGEPLAADELDREDYADALVMRLALQWPDAAREPAALRACVERALDEYAPEGATFRVDDFYLVLLRHLVAAFPAVNPFYYDLSAERVALHFPHTALPIGPPHPTCLVEEPPFVLLAPARRATPADLERGVLLLKSTVDCYRMNLIERLFPAADRRVVHLTRNPAAATNGLHDGWLHRGFFSHDLRPYLARGGGPRQLAIRGYSDRFPHGRWWWNFDLPPGWQATTERDLLDVCAFQWRSANAEILATLARGAHRHHTVRFEDIVRSEASRRERLERLVDFLGLPAGSAAALPLARLPVVQATLPPQLYRWKRRPDLLRRLLADPANVALSRQLGYHEEDLDGWL